jgi:predicted patatin/cPLA2 family phospholipase
MRQGDGACSDVMMVKHACSKQRVGIFVITSHKR